ncbi:MAG: hypothetical protein ABI707_04710 [Ferruginibacter sp.]
MHWIIVSNNAGAPVADAHHAATHDPIRMIPSATKVTNHVDPYGNGAVWQGPAQAQSIYSL